MNQGSFAFDSDVLGLVNSGPMPKAAVIIPARWGSTRFPGKPLHPIAGKPLLQHVWDRVRQADGIDALVIATDDERIANAAIAFGARVAFTSPNHRSGTDRIAQAACEIPGLTHVINVQGDEPLVSPALITRLVKALMDEPGLEMITAASVIGNPADLANPNMVKVVLNALGDALYFSRSAVPFFREPGAVPAYRHHGIYGYHCKFLQQFVGWPPSPLERAEQLEQLRALENGAKIRVLITDERSIGVDVPSDVVLVEEILRRK